MSLSRRLSGSDDPPRLGFTGLGWIGNIRMQSVIQAGAADVAALYDPVEENRLKASALAPHAHLCGTYEEMLEMDLDGIVIATPSALHATQCIAALERGKAVFCQKPLARTAEEVRCVIDAARAANRLLGVDLSYRWTYGLQKIRSLVQSGELGEVFAANLVFHNAYGPQSAWFYDAALSGGGCLMDLGIHLLDAALWILDSPVKRVTGRQLFSQGQTVATSSGNTVEDFGAASLELESGAALQLACSWRLHAGCDAVIELAFYGTRGGVAMCNVHGSFLDFRTELFRGTSRQVLSEPPEEWGGRALLAWVEKLAQSAEFDGEIMEHQAVAEALDAIYQREPHSSPLPLQPA